MTEPSQFSPFAASLHLTGFEQVSSIFAGWQGQFAQISSGRYEGDFQIVSGGLVRIVEIEANQSVRIRGHETSGLVWFYPVTPRSAASLWQGARLDAGRLVIQGIHAEIDHTSARGGETRVLAIEPVALADAIRSLLAADAPELPRTWAASAPTPETFDVLNARLLHFIDQGRADPSLLHSPEGRQAEQECLRALAAALDSASALQPDVRLPARARILHRAEEFMRSRLCEVVGAIDLCRELGVSDRTLRLAFQERYGVGPMTYYRFLRLNAVRSRLMGDPDVAIAEAAREFGFHHLGNFAADYRRLFGVTPSQSSRG